jgi:hypothetical protein
MVIQNQGFGNVFDISVDTIKAVMVDPIFGNALPLNISLSQESKLITNY